MAHGLETTEPRLQEGVQNFGRGTCSLLLVTEVLLLSQSLWEVNTGTC